MLRNILWKGLDADTTENCTVDFSATGIVIRSEIMGWQHGNALRVEYSIQLNKSWQVQHFSVVALINGVTSTYSLRRDENGNWWDMEDRACPQFKNCNFIDISVTPLTNSLPINALMSAVGDTALFGVVYIDLHENTLRKDTQQYTRLGQQLYLFENDGGSFTAEIEVDADGFVTFYPELFKILS